MLWTTKIDTESKESLRRKSSSIVANEAQQTRFKTENVGKTKTRERKENRGFSILSTAKCGELNKN